MPKSRKTTTSRPVDTDTTTGTASGHDIFATNPQDLLDQVEEEEQTPTLKAFDESGYERGRQLGKGAFGTVHQLDPTQEGGKKIALKTQHGNEGDLKDEAEALDRLGSHENIVGYEGVGTDDRGNSTLALEFLGGGDLDDMQEQLAAAYRARKISHEQYWGTLQYLMQGITRGIGHMNDEGMVHGDLKMGNVALDDETLTPKLVDFGTARDFDDYGGTMTPAINYAPERSQRGGRDVGFASKVKETNDIYSIGQMNHYAAKGEFHGADGGHFATMQRRGADYDAAMAGTYDSPFQQETAHDRFLAETMNPDPEQRSTAHEALQSDFLTDTLLDEEGARGVLARMLEERTSLVPTPENERESTTDKWTRHYGAAKTDEELSKENEEGRAERLAQARVQNKQDKLSKRKALKQAKQGTSKKDQKQKSAMLEELRKKTKGTRKALDKDATKRRKRLR